MSKRESPARKVKVKPGHRVTFWPRSSLVLISVAASGAVCGLLGAGAVLAFDSAVGLPPAEVQRLRKVAGGGLITTLLLTLVPGVDRLTHLGGVLTGALLMASGLLRPPKMASDDGNTHHSAR